jgi:hypothetical protein
MMSVARYIVKALLGLLLSAAPAAAQISQSGSVTPNTVTLWNSTGVVKGGVSAVDSPATGFSVTAQDAPALCVNSARQTAAGRNTLCLSASTTGPAKITLQNYGTATAQDLEFVINGTPVLIPTGGSGFVQFTGSLTSGHMPCWSGTTGLVVDCGVGAVAGALNGLAYYSATDAISSTGVGAAGQLLIGQPSAAPLWQTIGGDVQSVSQAGAVTISKVNGIPFATTYSAHGVLIGEGSSQFASVTTSSVGQCLLSQGAAADPVWSSCASGSGSAGGSNTQVQFNNSTALAGSANLTWVSPALTIGVAGTTTGQLALAPSAGASGTITVQNPNATVAYNFNLPTGAGTTGQPMISGGGGSTSMTFGTLGVFGGGTGCSVASGTCLDNITGFGSTGFVFRSGAGTYTFANPIGVGNGGTGLANGTSGGILGFTGTTAIASSGLLTQYSLMAGGGAGATPGVVTKGTAGQILIEQTGANPSWNSMSGDATINSAGALTIANSAVTVAKMANAAAYTLLGNFTGSSAAPQAATIGSLTQKASPAAGDFLLVSDQSASGQMKYATVASVASAGSVASINGATGAVTLLTQAQGRLTLQTGTPVMTTSQSNKATLYYDCYVGNQVPYYTGAADGLDTIAACEVSDAMVSAASAGQVVSGQVYDVWWVQTGANRICLAMSSSSGGGGGWASDTGGSNTARGTGYSQLDKTTRPYVTNKNSISNCFNAATNYGPVGANQGTYLGTIYATANGQTSWTYGAVASNWTAGLFGVWNNYNRVNVASFNGDSTDSWVYTTATYQAPNGNTPRARVTYVAGQAEESVFAQYNAMCTPQAGSGCAVGIGLDVTNAFTGATGVVGVGTQTGGLTASYTGESGLGLHFLSALEIASGGALVTFYGDNGGAIFQTGLSVNLRM